MDYFVCLICITCTVFRNNGGKAMEFCTQFSNMTAFGTLSEEQRDQNCCKAAGQGFMRRRENKRSSAVLQVMLVQTSQFNVSFLISRVSQTSLPPQTLQAVFNTPSTAKPDSFLSFSPTSCCRNNFTSTVGTALFFCSGVKISISALRF